MNARAHNGGRFADARVAEARLYGAALSDVGSGAFQRLWHEHDVEAERALLLSVVEVPEHEVERQRAHLPLSRDPWVRRSALVLWLDSLLGAGVGGDRDPREDRLYDDLRAAFIADADVPLMLDVEPPGLDDAFDTAAFAWETHEPQF